MAAGSDEPTGQRPVLYQICRAGDRFEVGDGPYDLTQLRMLVLGRGNEGGYDAGDTEDVIRVADPWMSGRHAAVQRVEDGHELRDLGSTNGVMLNGRRVEAERLKSGDLIETGRTFWVYTLIADGAVPPIEPTTFGSMSSWSPALAQQLGLLARAARGPQHILLTGESGVGKAYCARAIHDVSLRAGRFLTVDCSKTASDRLGTELFGSQDARAGALVLSSGGTVFMHRVELMPLDVQAVLANTLLEKRVTPRSGGKPVPVDIRVVASTEADLPKLVRQGKFDAALHTELIKFTMHLPSLRERREDLGLLIDSLLQRAGGAVAITRDACRALLHHGWPRNVRELAKIIEGGAILAGDESPVDLMHLPGVIAAHATIEGEAPHAGMMTNEHALVPPRDALEDVPFTTPAEPLDEAAAAAFTAEPLDEAAAAFIEDQLTDPDQRIPEEIKKKVAKLPPPPPPPPPSKRSATVTATPKVVIPAAAPAKAPATELPPPPRPKIIRARK